MSESIGATELVAMWRLGLYWYTVPLVHRDDRALVYMHRDSVEAFEAMSEPVQPTLVVEVREIVEALHVLGGPWYFNTIGEARDNVAVAIRQHRPPRPAVIGNRFGVHMGKRMAARRLVMTAGPQPGTTVRVIL